MTKNLGDCVLISCGRRIWVIALELLPGGTVRPLIVLEQTLSPSDGSLELASSAGGLLFYVTSGNPTEIRVCPLREDALLASCLIGSELAEHCVPLPAAAQSIVSCNNKIYAHCGNMIVGVDPLTCKSELFELPEAGTGLLAADDCTLVALSCDRKRVMLWRPGEDAVFSLPFSTPLRVLGTLNRAAVLMEDDPQMDSPAAQKHSGGRHPQLLAIDWSVRAGGSIPSPPVFSNLPFVVTSTERLVVSVAADPCQGFVVGGVSISWPAGFDLHDDAAVKLCCAPALADIPSCPVCMDDIALSGHSAADDSAEEGLTLDCGHRLHVSCLQMCTDGAESYLAAGDRVSFNRAQCPAGCGALVRTKDDAETWRRIRERHRRVAEITAEAVAALGDPTKVPDDVLCYICHSCGNPFVGGFRQCPRMVDGEPKKLPSELLCDACVGDFWCSEHGGSLVLRKCRWCCNPATHLCFGSFRTCDRCDAEWAAAGAALPKAKPCGGPGVCPVGGSHKETGSVAIGCVACMTKLSGGLRSEKIEQSS